MTALREPLPTLYELRANRDLSIEAVATRLGCIAGHVADLEAGAVVPTEDEIIALAAFYRVSAEALAEAADATRWLARKRPKRRGGRLEIVERQEGMA